MKAKFITFVRGLKNGTPPRFQSYLKSLTLLLAMVVSVNLAWGTTYDFTSISRFSDWGNSYSQRVVEYTDATVTFASASKQSSTITNMPVTKGSAVSVVLENTSNAITAVTFTCKQWSDKTQTITLKYSTNGGSSYSTLSPSVTSTNFTISSSSLPTGTNAVQITFSSTKNQVGIQSCDITISSGCTAPTYSISYDLDGGTYGTNHPTSAEIGTAFAVSPPTKANHTFTGWQVTSDLNTSTAKWGPGSALLTGTITSPTQKCIINTTDDIYFKDLGANGASVTLTATWEENTKYTITFADNLQHTASIPNTTNNEIVVYENEIFTFPTIDDKTAATSGTCEQVHYHFMGWVLSTHEGTIAAGDIKTGTSAAVTAAATYYAVWAKEEL